LVNSREYPLFEASTSASGMNMDVYEAILARRTVRDFQDREIELAIIGRILDAGLHAPTNNHLREWKFVVVNDKAARLSLRAAYPR
jgi:nitroreductase